MLLIPAIVVGQNHPGIDSQQMQLMMQQAKEMQACMKNIDKSEMQAFEKRGRQMEAEIKSMCKAGNRSEALTKAIEFSKEVAASSTVNQLKQCGEMMKGILDGLPKMLQNYEEDNANRHICDELT